MRYAGGAFEEADATSGDKRCDRAGVAASSVRSGAGAWLSGVVTAGVTANGSRVSPSQAHQWPPAGADAWQASLVDAGARLVSTEAQQLVAGGASSFCMACDAQHKHALPGATKADAISANAERRTQHVAVNRLMANNPFLTEG